MHLEIACLPEMPSRPPAPTTVSRARRPDYRMGAIASASAGMVALINRHGGRELFVVAADRRIVHYHPDRRSDTGFRAADTGLLGNVIAAGLDARGRIVLFAAQGLQMTYVREQDEPAARWSAPAACAVPMPPQAVAVEAIVASDAGGELLVAALVSARTADGVLNHLSWCAWPDDDGEPRMQRSAFATAARHCAWTGSGMEAAAFTAIDHGILDYRLASGRTRRRDLAPFTALDVASAQDASGTDHLAAILQDGRVHRLADEGAGRCAWRPLGLDEPCRQVGLGRDAQGAVHVFALGADNRLWHLAPVADAPNGYGEPALLLANVRRFGLAKQQGARNGQGDLDLFVIVGNGREAVQPAPAADGFPDDADDDGIDSIRRRIRWKTREAVELAQREWLAWYHPDRILQPLGYIDPA